MRYQDCSCPCNKCEGVGSGCIFDIWNYTDYIYLYGEEGGVFKLIIARNIRIGSPNLVPAYTFFTICIPMSGDMGVYQFTAEDGAACYAFVKKITCLGSYPYKYYFWIANSSTATEIPFENIDKTNYIHLYTTAPTEFSDGIRKYYLYRPSMLQYGGDVQPGTGLIPADAFFLPITMNMELPTVFWASPSQYRVELDLDGEFSLDWCSPFPPTMHTGFNFPYSSYNGTYILGSNGTTQFSPYFSSGGTYDSGINNIGSFSACFTEWAPGGGQQRVYYNVDVYAQFTVSVVADTVELFLNFTAKFTDSGLTFPLGGYTATIYIAPLSLDLFGYNSVPLECVDPKILTGDYGLYNELSTVNGIGSGYSCPPVDPWPCGQAISASNITGRVTVTVIEWKKKYGC